MYLSHRLAAIAADKSAHIYSLVRAFASIKIEDEPWDKTFAFWPDWIAAYICLKSDYTLL